MDKTPLDSLRKALTTGQRMSRESAHFFNDIFNARPDADCQVATIPYTPGDGRSLDLLQLHHDTWAEVDRVLGVPRALCAPYGAVAQRQWAKKYRFYDRLRIARNRRK